MEVFASIQGEGAYVGEPQVLLRLRGCPVRCRWCDTPASLVLSQSDRARVAAAAGARSEDPWATPFQAACWIAAVEPGNPRTVSVTGGEPLMWPDFLVALKPMIVPRRLHLETAGAHPHTLARVLGVVDHVSLDLKPDLDLDAAVELDGAIDVDGEAEPARVREATPRTREEWRSAREACLALVAGRDACGKIVVSGERVPEDFLPLFDEVERKAPGLALYVQPVTPMNGVRAASRALVEAVCEMAHDRDLAVRVVPQVHRLMKMP
ncbi:MAG: radical SAM protein [Planctomycetota bacterium]